MDTKPTPRQKETLVLSLGKVNPGEDYKKKDTALSNSNYAHVFFEYVPGGTPLPKRDIIPTPEKRASFFRYTTQGHHT